MPSCHEQCLHDHNDDLDNVDNDDNDNDNNDDNYDNDNLISGKTLGFLW